MNENEMNPYPTMREIVGLGHRPARLVDAALVLVDCQNTYRRGLLRLEGVEEAIGEIQKLLAMARDLDTPVIHVQHDSGPGSLYDIRADIGAIAPEVAPLDGEAIVIKRYPNSFLHTELEARLRTRGVGNVVLAGFMTHMCINSTAQGAFNLGLAPTVVASATATRPLMSIAGERVPAQAVHLAALATIRDLFGVVVETPDELLSA